MLITTLRKEGWHAIFLDIEIIAYGGIYNVNDIKSIINEKKADYVSMCRPFIIEPDLVKKFKAGKQEIQNA